MIGLGTVSSVPVPVQGILNRDGFVTRRTLVPTGAEPMQVVAVRLTAEEIAALGELAEREHLSRSEAIRRALADSAG